MNLRKLIYDDFMGSRTPPEMKRKILLTHDKGLLGDSGDVLIDDRPHKANCFNFKGRVLYFKEGMMWPEVLEYFRKHSSLLDGKDVLG